MTDAPERIWVWPDYNDHFNPVKQDWTHGFWDSTEDSLGTEYVRADRFEKLKAELAGGSFYQEKDIDALQDRLAAQAAEIERLNTQCEGLFQAAMNNGQALIIAEDKLAKAMLIIEAYSDDEGYIPKRVVHLWNALHCSNQRIEP